MHNVLAEGFSMENILDSIFTQALLHSITVMMNHIHPEVWGRMLFPFSPSTQNHCDILSEKTQDDSQQNSSCGSSPWPLQPSSRGKLILPLCMFPPIMPCIKAKVSSVEWNGKCKNNGPRSFSELKHLLDQRRGRIYTLLFNVRFRC